MAIALYDDGNHKCIAYEDLVTCDEAAARIDECDSVQSNQFLIVDAGQAAVIDPGGNLTYHRLFIEMYQHIHVKHLDYVIASHQDPDVVASINKWLVGTDCKVVVPAIWSRFVSHFCNPGATRGRLIGIPDEGMNIPLGNAILKAVPAHFLHSEGNFHFYDPVSRILFTGDVGASAVDARELTKPVTDMRRHIPKMQAFHRRYMNANKVCRLWVNMVRELDVEWIVPQHGPSFKGRKAVQEFLSWFEQLQCGVDLMTQRDYQAL
jgi:flavorubredoxin